MSAVVNQPLSNTVTQHIHTHISGLSHHSPHTPYTHLYDDQHCTLSQSSSRSLYMSVRWPTLYTFTVLITLPVHVCTMTDTVHFHSPHHAPYTRLYDDQHCTLSRSSHSLYTSVRWPTLYTFTVLITLPVHVCTMTDTVHFHGPHHAPYTHLYDDRHCTLSRSSHSLYTSVRWPTLYTFTVLALPVHVCTMTDTVHFHGPRTPCTHLYHNWHWVTNFRWSELLIVFAHRFL